MSVRMFNYKTGRGLERRPVSEGHHHAGRPAEDGGLAEWRIRRRLHIPKPPEHPRLQQEPPRVPPAFADHRRSVGLAGGHILAPAAHLRAAEEHQEIDREMVMKSACGDFISSIQRAAEAKFLHIYRAKDVVLLIFPDASILTCIPTF